MADGIDNNSSQTETDDELAEQPTSGGGSLTTPGEEGREMEHDIASEIGDTLFPFNRAGKTKTEYNIQKYNLPTVGRELERRWTTENREERMSVRDLATYFNTEIVRSILRNLDEAPAEYGAGDIVDILTADDPSAEDVEVVQNWFKQRGIDPNALTDDFVSHQSVFKYLRDVRGAEAPQSRFKPGENLNDAIEQANQVINRTEKTVQPTVERLAERGKLPHSEYDLNATLKVECSHCNRMLLLTELYRNGCGCSETYTA